jgi:RHS repeat-associated protein
MSLVTIISGNRTEITKYKYGTDGIRVSAEHEVWEDGELKSKTKTEYLNDPLNITGYSQVLKQTETDIVANEETVTTYLIGHQRISQIVVKNGTEQEYYFTFDGHGSTRVLLDFAGAIAQLYSFDAYGNAIGFNPAETLTEFLYSGEQFDSKIGQQYLRQRYYDPTTGRFNRLDPFFGNISDPLSFHKYLYCIADPNNYTDPNGDHYWYLLFFVAAATGAVFLLRPFFQNTGKQIDSQPMPSKDIESCKKALYNIGHERTTAFARDIEDGLILINVFQGLGTEQGMQNDFGGFSGNTIYISNNVLAQENSIALALVAFAEFQHTPQGGKLNEQNAQTEFDPVRQMILKKIEDKQIILNEEQIKFIRSINHVHK